MMKAIEECRSNIIDARHELDENEEPDMGYVHDRLEDALYELKRAEENVSEMADKAEEIKDLGEAG